MADPESRTQPSETRQLVHVGLGMATFQVFSFLTGLLVAAGLGPAAQGRFQLLISTCVLLAMFCKLGLDEGVSYAIPRFQLTDPAKVRAVATYAFALTTALGAAVGLCLRIAAEPLARSVFQLPGFETDLELAPLMLPLLVLITMGNSVLRGLGRSDLRTAAYYLPAGVGFFVLIVLLYPGGLQLPEVYSARIGSYLLGGVISLVLILRLVGSGTWRLGWPEVRQLHSFAGWLVPAGLFLHLIGQPLIDLMIVSRYGSPADVGVYSVGARIASLPGSIQSAFIMVLAPAFSRATLQGPGAGVEGYQASSARMAHLTVLSSALVLFFSDPVLALVGPEYGAAGPLLRVLLIGYVLGGVLGVNTPVLLAAGLTRLEFALSGGALALMIVAGVSLAPVFGPLGVAIATTAAIGTLALLRLFFCYRLAIHSPPRWLVEVGAFAVVSAVFSSAWSFLGNGVLGGAFIDASTFCGAYLGLMGLRRALERRRQ